jgi:hypothetical protein
MKGIAIFFDLFVRYMSKELNIVAIDYLSKLLINISDPHCMHLLLSNSMVSNMQTIKFVNMPVELAEYYINFLKSLSLKLNDSSIHLFYNQVLPMTTSEIPDVPSGVASHQVYKPPRKPRADHLQQHLPLDNEAQGRQAPGLSC